MTKHRAVRACTPRSLLLSSILISALVSGCAVAPIQDESQILASVPSADLSRARDLSAQGQSADAAKAYLGLAAKAQPPAQAQLQIKAAESYLAAGQVAPAKRTIDSLRPQDLTPGQQQLVLLTRAELALTEGHPKEAIADLERMQPGGLPTDLKAKRLGILASAQRLDGAPIDAAETLTQLDSLLSSHDARLVNQVSLVSMLSLLSQPQLQKASRQGRGSMKGWAEIALLAQQAGADPARLDARYRQWKQRHSGHPALPELGRAYAETLAGGYKAGDRVTLMLPRGGRFAAAARVIRDGIEAARRADAGGKRPDLDFADSTNAARVGALYNAATRKGASYVIGPLEKPAVDGLLARRTLAAPTLALNEASRDSRAVNLFQFSLSPENEAAEVASKASAMGARRALLLYPKDAWGERLASAFRRQWRNLGGSVAGQATFDPAWSTYDKTLAKLLGSGDADVLFLVATTEMARKIYPQIRATTPQPIPVISTSHVYSGTFDSADNVLKGLYFVDIPWMLDNDGHGALSRRAVKGAYSSGPLARLYAMGIDAYRLTPRLIALSKSPGAYYPGQTGGLAIDPLGRITRQLELGRFTDRGAVTADSLEADAEPN